MLVASGTFVWSFTYCQCVPQPRSIFVWVSTTISSHSNAQARFQRFYEVGWGSLKRTRPVRVRVRVRVVARVLAISL